MATAVYGIEHLKLSPAIESGDNAGEYPDFEEAVAVFQITAIVKDSTSYNDAAPGTNDIEVEDMDTFYARLPSDLGSKGFTVQTYDMGESAYKYLLGYTEAGNWMTETPGFVLANQAVELKSDSLDGFPSKIFQWARMKAAVTRTGTVGKSGFPNFNLEFTQLANLDKDGMEISGARWQIATPVVNL